MQQNLHKESERTTALSNIKPPMIAVLELTASCISPLAVHPEACQEGED